MRLETRKPSARSAASKARWADPEWREKQRAAISRGMSAWHRSQKAGEIEVPEWAARAGLAEVYRNIAERRGEEAAARECRLLKAGRP